MSDEVYEGAIGIDLGELYIRLLLSNFPPFQHFFLREKKIICFEWANQFPRHNLLLCCQL